jgi:uncharacterized phage protein (TIGR02216 family)
MRIDWAGLMQVGLFQLKLSPKEFWQLTPLELRVMLGVDQTAAPLTRSGLEELSKSFPDKH